MRRDGKNSRTVRTSPLEGEQGTIYRKAGTLVALAYPADYSVAASSLGAQTVYRTWNQVPGLACERIVLSKKGTAPRPLVTLETGHPISRAGAIGFSLSCETDLLGAVEVLDAAGISPLRQDRSDQDPPVIIGGPLTLVDPRLVAPLADAVVVGDGEAALLTLGKALTTIRFCSELSEALEGQYSGIWFPARQSTPPPPTRSPVEHLPAVAATWSPRAELKNLFLIEATRGCKRTCTFCVMSACARGAARFRPVPKERILEAVMANAPGVGLVGAAVTDHPDIQEIVERIAQMGKRVSLSSIRADRLTPGLAGALKKSGLRTLTLAADGSSDRLRKAVRKGIGERHLIRAVETAGAVGIKRLKLYSMLGLPDETDADVEELARLLITLADGLKLSVAIQAFVPKPGTPLENEKMAPISLVKHRLDLLKRQTAGRVTLVPTSPRWSWLDWKLAHGAERAAHAAISARKSGGSFAAWKKSILKLDF